MTDAVVVGVGPGGRTKWAGLGGQSPAHVRAMLTNEYAFSVEGRVADAVLDFLGRANPGDELRPAPGLLVLAVERYGGPGARRGNVDDDGGGG